MFSLYRSVTSRQEIRDSGRTRSLFGDATTPVFQGPDLVIA